MPSKNIRFIKNLFVYISCFLFAEATASDFSFQKRDSNSYYKSGWRNKSYIFSFGFGRQNIDYYLFNTTYATSNTFTLSNIQSTYPVHGKIEFFAYNHFGIGASANYSHILYNQSIYNSNNTTETSTVSHAVFTYNVRINYHFFYRRIIDLYVGCGIGYRFAKYYPFIPNGAPIYRSGFPYGSEATVGLRYLLKGIIGVYAEAGFGRSFLQGGLSFNINGFKKYAW